MYVRRDRSTLAFSHRRRRSSRWRVATLLVLLAVAGVTATQINVIQPTLLAALGVGPTATPRAYVRANAGYEAYLAGDLETAIAEFRRAVQQEPDNVDFLYELARLLVFTNREREALGQNRIGEAIEHAQRAIDSNPNDPRGHAIMCKALNFDGRPEAAIPYCLAAIEADPEFAESYAFLAEASADIKRWAQAQEYGKRAVEMNPYSVDARRAYAYSLWVVGVFQGAIEQLEYAVALHPNLTYLQLELALLYRVEDDIPSAIAIYDRIRTLRPNYARAYAELCTTYFYVREDAYAQDYCEQALQLDPNYQRAHQQIGMVYYTRRNYESAIDAFEMCACLAEGGNCDRNPDTPDVPGTGSYPVECWYLRGLAYYYLAQCNYAVPILTQALNLTDQDAIKDIIYEGLRLCRDSGSVFEWPGPTPTPLPEATPVGLP